MVIVQQLSALAVRQLLGGICQAAGVETGPSAVETVVGLLVNRFTDHSPRLVLALQRANARAWRVLEIALAGDSWWDRIKVSLARTLLVLPPFALLDGVPGALSPSGVPG